MSRLRFNPSQIALLQNAMLTPLPMVSPPTVVASIADASNMREDTQQTWYFVLCLHYLFSLFFVITILDFLVFIYLPLVVYHKWIIIVSPLLLLFYITWILVGHNLLHVCLVIPCIITQIIISVLPDPLVIEFHRLYIAYFFVFLMYPFTLVQIIGFLLTLCNTGLFLSYQFYHFPTYSGLYSIHSTLFVMLTILLLSIYFKKKVFCQLVIGDGSFANRADMV